MDLAVLSGVNESRLTFLAVRRWYGWSAGRIINLDIGGGSLELSCGVDEEPDIALSLPLGAGRLTREWLAEDPPGRRRVAIGRLRDSPVLHLPAQDHELRGHLQQADCVS
ncbi:exopolyphosphatase [Mycobacteroides abscessus subsp. massiliense]|nr:exopolyphosphatase [Mycobacteroides abscessus subsp. massiliense]